MKRWTAEEDAKLREHYASKTRGELAALLGRTDGMVRSRCWTLELHTKRRPWTQPEIALLRRAYAATTGGGLNLRKLAKRLRRPYGSVALKASRLGLTHYGRPKTAQLTLDLRVARFATEEELRAAQSTIAKKRIAEHGHPRGALGLHHTEAVKEASRTRSRAMWADPGSKLNSPEQRQRRSDLMHRRAVGRPAENCYSRCARGRRADLGDIFFRSRWEANYARFLNEYLARGWVSSWEYEPRTFIFNGATQGVRSYTPDFLVHYTGTGGTQWHEVKGWMDQKSVERLRLMAEHYPEETVLVVGADWFKGANRSLATIVDGWEPEGRRSA